MKKWEVLITMALAMFIIVIDTTIKAGISLLTYFSLLALVLSLSLPKRKLVEAEPELAEVG
jgi:hypothetical protein